MNDNKKIIVEAVKKYGNKENTIAAIKWMPAIAGAKTIEECEAALIQLSQEDFDFAVDQARKSGRGYVINNRENPVERLAFYIKYAMPEKVAQQGEQ